MSGRLLTAREVAELLGVSPETVLRWTRRGDLPARRLHEPGAPLRRGRARGVARRAHATGAADREVSTTRADRAPRSLRPATLSSVDHPAARARPTTEEEPDATR